MKIIILAVQLLTFLLLSPLISGLISKLKNNLRMRKGQGVLQPYYNLFKLFSKEEVISETASWIYRVTPFVVFASTLTAALLIPLLALTSPLQYLGDFLALIFIFALGRFFLALAALDTSSAFGGMGASREMFISSLAEPVACLAAFVLALQFGSSNISLFSGMHPVLLSSLIAAIALLFVAIAETSRIPIDNQETHLELTMVHEAMVLEYSGKSLALLELSAAVKQMIWFLLIAQIIFPMQAMPFAAGIGMFFWLGWFCLRLIIIAVFVAVLEVSLAKMRLLRVVDYFGFAFLLSVVALVCAIIGV
ncbi:MAG: NADH-quinone oxidoreductase subunit H [Candidatus Omnitrophica bacterium]|nr:NADH-quinone oxidoreductase subunit H [Candidatus Omnitrophota bacterium]